MKKHPLTPFRRTALAVVLLVGSFTLLLLIQLFQRRTRGARA